MSGLQDALHAIDDEGSDFVVRPIRWPWTQLIEAARRVADGEGIWWCEVHEMKGIEDMCGWTRVKNVTPGSCRMVPMLLIDPPEET